MQRAMSMLLLLVSMALAGCQEAETWSAKATWTSDGPDQAEIWMMNCSGPSINECDPSVQLQNLSADATISFDGTGLFGLRVSWTPPNEGTVIWRYVLEAQAENVVLSFRYGEGQLQLAPEGATILDSEGIQLE